MEFIEQLEHRLTTWQQFSASKVILGVDQRTVSGRTVIPERDPFWRDIWAALWLVSADADVVWLKIASEPDARLRIDMIADGKCRARLQSSHAIDGPCNRRERSPRRRLPVVMVSENPGLQRLMADVCQWHALDLTCLSEKSYRTTGSFQQWEHIFIDTSCTSDYLLGENVSIIETPNSRFDSQAAYGFDVLATPLLDWTLAERVETSYRRRAKKVLLAEDSGATGLLMCHLLSTLGCDVVYVKDGRSALDKARRMNFDLMVFDERLPGLRGSEVAEQLRDTARGRDNTPIISVTGVQKSEDLQQIYSAGVTALLQKPVESRSFKRFFSHWLPSAA